MDSDNLTQNQPNQQFTEHDQKAPNRKKILLLSGVLLIIVVILVVTTALISRSSTETARQNQENNSQKNPSTVTNQAPGFPTVEVNSWQTRSAPPQQPETVQIFRFSQSLTSQDAQALAKRFLGTADAREQNGTVIGYKIGQTETGQDDISTFVSTLATGEFSYASTTGIDLPDSNGSTQQKTDAYIQSLLSDPTVKISANYQRRSKPGVVYYEAHRDWITVGLPILNAIGLLNFPENLSLSKLSITTPVPNQPSDEDIIATSDRTNGLARQNDFNTITVGVNTQTGTIVHVSSNIRRLQGATKQTTPVLGYEDALAQLKNGQYAFFYTNPSGEGVPNFEQVFPNNAAIAKEGVITESVLSYVEQPPQAQQSQMNPHWIFRGNAELSSGYRVNFVAGVSAVASRAQGFNLFRPVYAQAEIPDTTSNNDGTNQKQSTFGNTPIPATSTPRPTQTPQTTPQPTAPGICIPDVSDLTNIRQVAPNLNVGQITSAGIEKIRSDNARVGDWYSYAPSGKTLTADELMAAIQAVPADGRNVRRLEMEQIYGERLGRSGPGCPLRITGRSPSIFVYGQAGHNLSIFPQSDVSYAEPGLSQSAWDIKIAENGLEVNGVSREYLYYEYINASFDRPENGWNIAKNDILKHSTELANQLGLNTQETKRLAIEIQNAASHINANHIFIGLIPQNQVDTLLPLRVHGASHIERIHLYVSRPHEQITEPSIVPVERSASMIVELGAYFEE